MLHRISELAVATRECADAIQARTESERQYRDLVESASDIIFRTDAVERVRVALQRVTPLLMAM